MAYTHLLILQHQRAGEGWPLGCSIFSPYYSLTEQLLLVILWVFMVS